MTSMVGALSPFACAGCCSQTGTWRGCGRRSCVFGPLDRLAGRGRDGVTHAPWSHGRTVIGPMPGIDMIRAQLSSLRLTSLISSEIRSIRWSSQRQLSRRRIMKMRIWLIVAVLRDTRRERMRCSAEARRTLSGGQNASLSFGVQRDRIGQSRSDGTRPFRYHPQQRQGLQGFPIFWHTWLLVLVAWLIPVSG